MALNLLTTVNVIEEMENYISKIRPPKEIRDMLDVNYRLENQSIILFEIRPEWDDNTKYQNYDFAKITFVKKLSKWKMYWMRNNSKWELYEPEQEAIKLSDLLTEIDEDRFGCFGG